MYKKLDGIYGPEDVISLTFIYGFVGYKSLKM